MELKNTLTELKSPSIGVQQQTQTANLKTSHLKLRGLRYTEPKGHVRDQRADQLGRYGSPRRGERKGQRN